MSQQVNEIAGSHRTKEAIDLNPRARTASHPECQSVPTPVGSNTKPNEAQDPAPPKPEIGLNDASFCAKGTRSGHGSISKSRGGASPKAKKTPYEPINPIERRDNTKSTILSPRMSSILHDKPSQPKAAITTPARTIPEVPARPAFFENVTKPSQPSLPTGSPPSSPFAAREGHNTEDLGTASLHTKNGVQVPRTKDSIEGGPEPPSAWLNEALPQALSCLNVDLINFICDVYEEDGTLESHLASPQATGNAYPQPENRPHPLARRSSSPTAISKKQWKGFNEQTLFNVLMDPKAVVQSFTCDNKLYDSQTLWYCFYRMNRVAPSLVLHSLWLAAGRLFVPPTGIKVDRLAGMRTIENQGGTQGLSSAHAGYLVSICMHALVAAAPVVPDSRTLYEMSRIRSNGLTLAGGTAVARQPSSRCLGYDDVFSNDLAIRLARRLFCAITARRYFADMSCSTSSTNTRAPNPDILQPLVSQLDFLSTGSASVLEFAHSERLLHETRVPTVLLDWARTIILNEWNGKPDFTMDGPFGGALSFIETMRKLTISNRMIEGYHTSRANLRLRHQQKPPSSG